MGTESTSKGKGGICKGIIAFYVYVYVKKKVFLNSFKFSVLYVLREGGIAFCYIVILNVIITTLEQMERTRKRGLFHH